jgi:Ni,Fe-hydrogenase III component G
MSGKTDSVLKSIAGRGHLELDGTVKGAAACKVKMELFVHAGRVLKEEGFRLVAEWASDESAFGRGFEVHAAYCGGGDYLIIKTEVLSAEPSFQSLTRSFPAASRFEGR